MAVSFQPAGYHTATAYLIIRGAAQAIEFYKQAFGATELFRLNFGDRIGHAEIKIGDSPIMLADEFPDMGIRGPQTLGGTSVSLMLYVEAVDEMVATAVKAGATLERPVQDQFYGDRSGTVIDPFGHKWTIATHVEDVSSEEMARRMAEWEKQQKK